MQTLEGHRDYIFGMSTWKNSLITGDYGCNLIQWLPNGQHVVVPHCSALGNY